VQTDGFQVAPQRRPKPRRRQRIVQQHLLNPFEGGNAAKGRAAGQGLVQQHTQGVDIGGRPDRPAGALRLLGGHVVGRAGHLAGQRHP
jgi:hypothetical protein